MLDKNIRHDVMTVGQRTMNASSARVACLTAPARFGTKLVVMALALGLLTSSDSFAQKKKKPDDKGAPQIALAVPFCISAGKTTRVTIRGNRLDKVTELRFPDVKASGKILTKKTVPVPDKQNAAKVGNTQVEADITLPAGVATKTVSLLAVSPEGQSAPYQFIVNGKDTVLAEKEPNDGFRQAQPIQIPQTIDGMIDHAQDVDVFRFDGRAGQKIVFEVFAARYGSALDSYLTLYDAGGHQVGANDDFGDSFDSRLEVTLSQTGPYYLSLIDAHDDGGPLHVYRLVVTQGK